MRLPVSQLSTDNPGLGEFGTMLTRSLVEEAGTALTADQAGTLTRIVSHASAGAAEAPHTAELAEVQVVQLPIIASRESSLTLEE